MLSTYTSSAGENRIKAIQKAEAMIASGDWDEIIRRQFTNWLSPYYGHTLWLHFNINNDDLIHRAKKLHNGATAFDITPQEFAEITLNILLEPIYASELLLWYYTSDDEGEIYCLDASIEKQIGYGFLKPRILEHDWNDGPVKTSDIRYVFRIDRSNPYEKTIKIITAYPIFDGMGMENLNQ